MGVWEHNLKREEVIWDEQMYALYCAEHMNGKVPAEVWSQRLHPEDVDRAFADLTSAVTNAVPYASDFRIIWPDGRIRHLRSRARHYVNDDGEPCLIGGEWDVTDHVLMAAELREQQVKAEEAALLLALGHAEVAHAANHDYLTGLSNRRHFDSVLREVSNDTKNRVFVLFHIDVDQFKRINDTYGHPTGDEVLRHVATSILRCLPVGGTAARIGGDEFVVLFPGASDESSLVAAAEDLIARIANPLMVGGKHIIASVSIGISTTRQGSLENLPVHADMALYEAKRAGRGQAHLFETRSAAQALVRRQLSADLEPALTTGDILPFYQIQVSPVTRVIIGLEALARWRHPTRGLLPPNDFLPVAEEAGLAAELDAAILFRVFEDRDRWTRDDKTVPQMAVNLSAARLQDESFIKRIRDTKRSLVGISFELVETVFLDDPTKEVLDTINILRALGARIEIDDFGTGNASLLGLLKIRPDRLKLDRHLIADVAMSVEKRRVLSSILDIAKALNIGVVAEGIETEEQAAIMSELGCEVLQGYLFGRPQPFQDIRLLSSPEAA
ncbi:diguanylate cyclase (GGDEF) domain-containing protein [Rhizobium sp. NFR03]|nr:diguanylate cyclase (GGDEF) domain-containing protein [Rhizobium sp. NFR03]